MATLTKTKADQIFEAAQTAYASCKALRKTVEDMMRAQGINPQELKKKTQGVYLDVKELNDKDALVAGVLLTDIARQVNRKNLHPKQDSNKPSLKLRARI